MADSTQKEDKCCWEKRPLDTFDPLHCPICPRELPIFCTQKLILRAVGIKPIISNLTRHSKPHLTLTGFNLTLKHLAS